MAIHKFLRSAFFSTIFALLFSAVCSAAQNELKFDLGGWRTTLPKVWERLDQPKNFIVQERARNSDTGSAFSGGSFELELTLEQYTGLGLLGLLQGTEGPEGILVKIAQITGVSITTVEAALASKIGNQVRESLKQASTTLKMELLKSGKATIDGEKGFEIHSKITVIQSGQTLYSRQFIMRGSSPNEIVQLTFAGSSKRILTDETVRRAIKKLDQDRLPR